MNFKEIKIENYKCFKSARLSFSKLTLLLGANSSGKTAALSALLVSLQSRKFPLYLSLNGNLINTGDYKSVVWHHDSTKSLSISITLEEVTKSSNLKTRRINAKYMLDPKTHMPRMQAIDATSPSFNYNINIRKSNYQVNWTYVPGGSRFDSLKDEANEFYSALESFVTKAAKNRIGTEKRRKKTSLGESNHGSYTSSLSKIDNFFEAKMSFDVGLRWSEEFNSIQEIFHRMRYLGSSRSAPERTYYHGARPSYEIDVDGGNTVEQLLAWNTEGSNKISKVARALKKLGLATSVKLMRLAGGRFELRVRPRGSAVASSISDVGFGVNQFLPILVAEEQLGRGGVMIISQPETHLHPSVQADVATHFVDQIKQRDFTYVVETHSEYFINRIRRLICRGDISPADVAVNFIEANKDGAVVHHLVFETDGRISNAPKNFFETYSEDVLGIALKN